MSKLTDEQIKAAYVGRFGTVMGWLDLPGSYFLAGFQCAHAKCEAVKARDGAEATSSDEKTQGQGLPVGHKGQEP